MRSPKKDFTKTTRPDSKKIRSEPWPSRIIYVGPIHSSQRTLFPHPRVESLHEVHSDAPTLAEDFLGVAVLTQDAGRIQRAFGMLAEQPLL